MNFTLLFTPDEIYYKEAYAAMISSLRYKKYEPVFATVMIVFWTGLYLYDTNKTVGLFSLFMSAVGVFEFYKIYLEKKKWMKNRMNSKVVGQKIEIHFNDLSLTYKEPLSNGEIRWEGIKTILKTKNGILIKPENGIGIYFPFKHFANDAQIEFILSKANQILTQP